MIVVPYAAGSATPSQTALAAETRHRSCAFIVDPDDLEATGHVSILRQFGSVIETNAIPDILRALPERPSAVVAFAERSIPLSAALTDHFALPGHAAATMRLLVDKAAQRDRLNAKGVGFVPSVNVMGGGALPGQVPLPGVLKPRAGAGSRDTFFVDDIAELAAALRGLDPAEPTWSSSGSRAPPRRWVTGLRTTSRWNPRWRTGRSRILASPAGCRWRNRPARSA